MPVPQPHVPLPGSRRVAPADARPVGAVDPQQEMAITVYLRRRNEDEFHNYLAQHIAQPWDHARRHLSYREFAERFGAGDREMQAVEQLASAYGLRVEGWDPARRMVRLQGRAEQFAAAFRVTMQTYEARGRVFRAREGTIQVPAHLLDVIVGVFGLDHRPQAVPHFRIKRSGGPGGAAPQAVSGPSFNPTDLADLYQFPAGVNGAGETIGIIELGGGYTPDDLQTYFARLGISPAPNVTSVSVDGGQNQPGDPTGADSEVGLDIEVAGAVAPGANQKVFFTPNTDQGFLDAVTQAVQDPDVTIISISWGQAESGWTSQALTSFNQAFQDAAALGKTVFAAAGDSGSTDGQSDGQNHVDFPASSPYVAGCGGTTLRTSDGQIASETVWNEQASGQGATGGGVSAVFAPPDYQRNAGVPPAPTSAGGRGVPDVAADADPETGYNVVVDGQPMVVGGTSAVAPLYAGLFALINQNLHAQGKPRAGFVQPVLYANQRAFHDITQGNNGAFSAGPGWDATTGLGSPIGQQILAAFLTPRPPAAG